MAVRHSAYYLLLIESTIHSMDHDYHNSIHLNADLTINHHSEDFYLLQNQRFLSFRTHTGRDHVTVRVAYSRSA